MLFRLRSLASRAGLFDNLAAELPGSKTADTLIISWIPRGFERVEGYLLGSYDTEHVRQELGPGF